MARIFASRFACVSTTPLGSPVEPEVYCNSAISLALRARLPERCAGNAPGAGGRSFVRSGKKLFRVGDRFERMDTRLQQFRHGFGSPESQQQTHFGVC